VIPRLFFVTDGARGTDGRSLLEVIRGAAAGGVEGLVLREPSLEARALGALCDALAGERARGLRVLVSRRLDLARAFELDGVHLARDAVPVAEARAWLGREALIGYSAHEADEAREAERSGASYLTLSPIHPTDSKPGVPGRGAAWLARAVRGLRIPALALGGMTPERTREVIQFGAHGVAAVSAIGRAPDPAQAARAFRAKLEESPSRCAS
jgi:thiamine-phosphate pyrophosphorylase